MHPKNIKEAKELIVKYRSVTIDDIKDKMDENYFFQYNTAKKLTGFGTKKSCTLCISVDSNCEKCIYNKYFTDADNTPCQIEENKKSYFDIKYSKDAEDLLQAFRNRADHIENLIKKFE